MCYQITLIKEGIIHNLLLGMEKGKDISDLSITTPPLKNQPQIFTLYKLRLCLPFWAFIIALIKIKSATPPTAVNCEWFLIYSLHHYSLAQSHCLVNFQSD